MKHFWLSGLLGLFLGVSVSLQAEAADYFVEKGGNDANPGSRMQPFRTIQKAAGLMLPGDVCTISRGVYRETVRPAVSGKPDKWIRFQSAPGETVTIAGADDRVTWQQVTGAIYRASATNVIQALVDEALATDTLDINDLAPALSLRASYWYDPLNYVVYIRLPHNDAPEGHHIELQTRGWGLDFHKLSYIEVQGINLTSCGMNWTGARFCRMNDGHIWWGGGQVGVTNILGGVTNATSIRAAVIMGGRENELANSSVIGSDGYGVVLLPDGVNNRLLNTLVRGRDVPLESAFGILAQGTAPLIRNVSVMNFSGGALLCSNVFNARIENNDFYRCGAGQTNVSLIQLTGDGKGTVLAFNWVHDNVSAGGDGVRFRGPVENYVFRQNVVWGQPGMALRLAGKARYNYLLNNTCASNGGGIDSELPAPAGDFGETRVMNNILTGPSWTVQGGGAPPKLVWAKNYIGSAPGFVDETNRNFQLATGSPCIDAGQEEPEFTDEYSGKLPDMGAYEQGKPYPVPGCRVNENANKVIAPVVKVVLETETAEAEVRYTLDGRLPDQSSERYTGAVSVVYGALVKARAFRQGMEESTVTTVQVRRVE
jgi:hypothetical protein